MSVVKKLSVQNIRSHDKYSINFDPKITVITGNNGSGKTSLIEALYIGLQGCSFKGSDVDILKTGSDWWRIDINFNTQDKRSVSYDKNLILKKKKIVIDDKISYRLNIKDRIPVVLFEPDDLRLLHGSPTRRRDFIDRFISQLDPVYLNSLHKYDRALKQRNKLLKTQFFQQDELFAWDISLSEYGSYIIEKRIAFIEQINSKLNNTYNLIAKSKDSISVHYSQTYIGDIKQKLINDLHAHQERDKYLGFTSVGPHRHDVIFKFNNLPAMEIASRGEVRSIVLALKFLEVDIIEQITDTKPIILLDDVFSELDDERQKRLFTLNNQVIITSTKLPEDIKTKIKSVELDNIN